MLKYLTADNVIIAISNFDCLNIFHITNQNTWTGEKKEIAKQLHSIILFLANSLLLLEK